ncbi:hypothetical protein BJY00DRAFT_100485 [Aspergillus carlsbadensis]|nr:hypothetical protein BJY00DRAFT_100485 [Aspergillus carlsbadensis]
MSGEEGGEVREDYGDINKAQQDEEGRKSDRESSRKAQGKLREGKKSGSSGERSEIRGRSQSRRRGGLVRRCEGREAKCQHEGKAECARQKKSDWEKKCWTGRSTKSRAVSIHGQSWMSQCTTPPKRRSDTAQLPTVCRASMDNGTVVASRTLGDTKDWTMMSHLLSVACFPGFLDGSIAVWMGSLTLHREGEGLLFLIIPNPGSCQTIESTAEKIRLKLALTCAKVRQLTEPSLHQLGHAPLTNSHELCVPLCCSSTLRTPRPHYPLSRRANEFAPESVQCSPTRSVVLMLLRIWQPESDFRQLRVSKDM